MRSSRFVLALITLTILLALPAGPWSPAAPAQTADQVPHFTGLVQYDPGSGGDLLPQADVPVFLYGLPRDAGTPVLLDSDYTAPDGSFDLYTRTATFSAYVVLKEEVRGLVPFTATPGLNGRLWDPSAVLYAGDFYSDVYDTGFILRDSLRFPIRFRERYLIVTSDAVVPALEGFINYKEFLGFDVLVVTVEELDPTGIGGQFRRDQIRDYERSLDEGLGGLEYVLLIGTDTTIPFLKIAPGGADWVRFPYEEWPEACRDAGVPYEANMCGRSTDWYYVDLYSDWDSSGDGVLGERFWTPEEPSVDNPPAFGVDVYLGRLPFDNPATVEKALGTIMAFEQDDGDWKKHVLLAGAMTDMGGWTWDPISTSYKLAHGPTDNAYLMEHAYSDYLSGEGFSRVRLYEKDHPGNCDPPSFFPVDAPLTLENVIDEWTSQDFGLVKTAGHGSEAGVGRLVWAHDYDITPTCVVQDPTRPLTDNKSLEEVVWADFLLRDNADQMLSPSDKAPVLMAMACATGAWYTTNNLPSVYMAAGRIAAWIGGTCQIGQTHGWTLPSQDGGQAVDYRIGEAIFEQNLPLGDGFWTGLDNVRQEFGATWGTANGGNSAFLSLDLYGDPSMDFWGNGADTRGPWPMFHYDWPGRGQTSLAGPGLVGQVYWTADIAPTPAGSRVPSPVVNQDNHVVIGDSGGVVRSIDMAGNVLWSYQTDGPIDTAAALGLAGTIYVQTTNGTLYAIRENGTLYWSRTVGQSDASPKVGPIGWIYVGGSDSGGPGGSTRYLLLAYRADGERKGLVELDGRVTTTPSFGEDGGVLVGTAAGTLYELTPELEIVGGHSLGQGHAIADGLAVAGDFMQTVLVPTTGGFLIAWTNLYDFPLWFFSGCGPLRSAPAVTEDGKVIFGSQDGKVCAIRLVDGEKIWEYDTGGPVDSSAALDTVFAYVVGGNPAHLYILRTADGTFFPGFIEIGGSAEGGSSPAIGESKMLYVASAEGALYAIGKLNWPQPPVLSTKAWPWEIDVQIQAGDALAWHLLERRVPGSQWSVRAELAPGVAEFHDSTVLPGVRYQYRAVAFLSGGSAENPAGTRQQPEYSEYSPIVQVRALRAVPEAPGSPTVTPLSSSELRLEWQAAPTASIGLRIWRLDPGQPDYAEIALLPGEATSFVDSGLLSDTIYLYRLQAVDEAGDSPLSEPGEGTTWARTIPAPRQVTVWPLEGWSFRVCWVPGGSEYESIVARAAAGEMEAGEIGHVAAGQTCFTDTHGFASSFEYRVKHVAGQDESDWALSAPTTPPDWLVAPQPIYLPIVFKSAAP